MLENLFTEFTVLAQIAKLRKWLRKPNFFASDCTILSIWQVLLSHHLRNFAICAKMRNPVNKFLAQKKGYNDLSPIQSTKLDRAKPVTTPSLEAMSQSSDEVESDASSGVKPAKRSRLPSSGSGLRILQCTTLYNVHFILFSLKQTFPSYADFESDEQNSEFDTKSYLS